MTTMLFDDVRMAAEVRKGLPFRVFTSLKNSLKVSREVLANAIQLSGEGKVPGRLETEQSERLLRFMRIQLRAQTVLGSAARAKRWIFSSNPALGGSSPFEFASTEPGAREVEKILGRIQHGIFS